MRSLLRTETGRGRATRLMALLAVLALVVAACGDSTDEETTTTAPAADETTTTAGADEETTTTEAAGDEDPMAELIEAAQAEGEVVVYGAPAEATVVEWVTGFEETYGIPVVYHRATSNQVQERWAQETEAGQHFADVIIHSLPLALADASDLGWVAEYVPTSNDAFADSAKIEGRVYPLYLSVDGIGYNVNNVTDEEIEMLRDMKLDAFTDPIWDGRITNVSMLAGGPQLANYQQIIEVWEADYGWDFLEEVGALDPVIFDSGVPMTEQLIAGEYDVSFTLPTTIAAAQVLDGAPVQWTYRNDPSAGMFTLAISENAPGPNAGRLFAEWALSLEGQSALVNINQGIAAHADWVDERPIAQLDWYEPYEGTPYIDWAFDRELQDRVDDLYGRFSDIFGLGG